MTMADYKKALAQHIPMPATIQQELLMKAVMNINEQLKKKGSAYLSAGRCDGNRTTLCAMARSIKNLYKSKGYAVSLYEYSENNRDSYFCMSIEIGG